jgi:hypothetical protein
LALVLVFGGLLSESIASASALPKVNVAGSHVTCSDLLGSMTFSVPYFMNGGSNVNTVKVTMKSGDCFDLTHGSPYDADTNPSGVTLKGVTFTGTLTSTTNSCASFVFTGGLQQWLAGGLIGKFSTPSGTPGLVNNQLQMLWSQMNWAAFNSDAGWSHPELQMGQNSSLPTVPASLQGAYDGGGGASSQFDIVIAQSLGDLNRQCASSTGLRKLQFGIGSFQT